MQAPRELRLQVPRTEQTFEGRLRVGAGDDQARIDLLAVLEPDTADAHTVHHDRGDRRGEPDFGACLPRRRGKCIAQGAGPAAHERRFRAAEPVQVGEHTVAGARAELGAEHRIERERPFQLRIAERFLKQIVDRHRDHAQKLAHVGAPEPADVEPELRRRQRPAPAAPGEPRRQPAVLAREYRGVAAHALHEVRVCGRIGRRRGAADDAAAIEHQRGAAVAERDRLEPALDARKTVGRKCQLALDHRIELVDQVRKRRHAKAARDFSSDCRATDLVARLEHQDVVSTAGQVRRTDEAVVAGANDDGAAGISHRSSPPERCCCV